MIITQYSPRFIKKLKNVDVRIKKSFKEKLKILEKNPQDPGLRNHELKREYAGLRSIDVTVDYRAVYKEFQEEEDTIIYFTHLGTHEELYGKTS
jgi:addiction module RelE/StbE family toxin